MTKFLIAWMMLAVGGTAWAQLDVPPPDPLWKTLEREIFEGFRPDAKAIGVQAYRAVGSQIVRGLGQEPRVGVARRGLDGPVVPHDPEAMARDRAEQVAASQARFDAPAPTSWRHVEVDLVVDGDGRVREVQVATSSGRIQLDEVAVAAVRNAAQRRPLREQGKPGQTRRVRFALDAAVGVNLPKVTMPVEPVSGRVGKGAIMTVGGRLDGTAATELPLARRVFTKVELVRTDFEP